MKYALGLIETIGLITAIEAADSGVKAANVVLLGYENTKGGGKITVKFAGEVGAVNAAVAAGMASASKIGKIYSFTVIPRPHEEIDALIRNADRGRQRREASATPEPPAPEPLAPEPPAPKPAATQPAALEPAAPEPVTPAVQAPVASTASSASSAAVATQEELVLMEGTAPRQCAAISKSGVPCKLTALPGSDYCFVHRARNKANDKSAN